jgi:hypothetical protein
MKHIHFWTLAALFFSLTAATVPASPVPAPAGLVGWWKGDGNTLDSSGGNNNGVNQNVNYTNGIVGQAFACDPENYPYGTYCGIQIADQPAYVLTNSLTIEGWIRPRGNSYAIFWRGDNRPGLDPYALSSPGDGTVGLQITDANGNTVTVGTLLPFNVWTYVAATLDGSSGTMSFYTNGVLAAQTNTSIRPFGDLIAGDSPGIGIGNVNDGQNNFPFIGDIDEISLYNRALSQAEIQGVFNAGSAGKILVAATNPPASAPANLVAWWKAEGNGADSAGTNNATVPAGVTYAPAEVGLGFNLDGQPHQILVPDAPQLDFSSNQDFSIETWIQPLSNPGNFQDVMTVVSKRIAPDTITQLGYELFLQGGVLCFQMADTLAPYSWHNFSAGPDLRDGLFHHVAVTVQRNSTNGGRFYIDGQSVLTFDPTTCPGDLSNPGPLRIGNHPDTNILAYYHGIIDEASIYRRALTANEIAAIYTAGSAGKALAPRITIQPASQTAQRGETVSFSAAVAGTPPLVCQWKFGGKNIAGATNLTLALINVQPAAAGNYALNVTNAFGSAMSSNALLTVTAGPPPACTPPPVGLVGWWKGDGNAVDSFAGNNGINQNVNYTNGVVDQAFAFDPESLPYGTYSGIQVADQPAYALTNALTIEGWVRPRGDGYIIFWRGDHRPGLDPYYLSMQANNTLRFGICDADGNGGYVDTLLNYFAWTHVAATLDGRSGTLSIYTNGVLAAHTNTIYRPFATLEADQSPGVGIGNLNDGGNNFPFTGDIDEISLYNLALTADEIQSIYNAGSAGKCLSPSLVGPTFIVQPTNTAVEVGSNASFSAALAGTLPIHLQWYFKMTPLRDGGRIRGATNATLQIADVQPGDGGNYRLVASNLVGVATSTVVTLTPVILPPVITTEPVSQTVAMGTNVVFRVVATGTPELQYQWRQNQKVVGDSATLVLNRVGRAQSGIYYVRVSNAAGTAVSSNAFLKVRVPQQMGPPRFLPNGAFQFTSTDMNGGLLTPADLANFEAQSSTNLINWVTLPNALSLTNGRLFLQDPAQTNSPARYYRIIEH